MSEANRSQRKTLTGVVVSRSGDKTIKVAYLYKTPHPLYGKEVKRRTMLHAHDEANACKAGDTVEITQTRPLSKMKRWRVVRVVDASKVALGTAE
jgi:small subunit ribosomal protein S17